MTKKSQGGEAVAEFIIGEVISVVKNGLATLNGEIKVEDAIVTTAQDAVQSQLRSGVTGAGSALIKYGVTNPRLKALAKSNIAVAIADGVIDVGASVYSFAKGEITAIDLIERVGQTGTCTACNMYAKAVMGAIFAPIAAVAGSMTGYLVAGYIYQSATTIFKQARLAEAEAERVVAICEAACQAMVAQRAEFERLFEANFPTRCAEFDACFAAIDMGLASNQPESTTQALGDLAALFGKKLQFETFEDFDDFMINLDLPLVL